MITDERQWNLRTRCTLGDTESFEIDGRGCDAEGRRGGGRMKVEVTNERMGFFFFRKRGKRGERASEVLTETK